MNGISKVCITSLAMISFCMVGCTPRTVDFSSIERPARAAEMDAYNVFVGNWNWDAKMTNAADEDKDWSGTANWSWTLDNRCLHGVMSGASTNASWEAAGIWSWHPNNKRYIWWMFNDWGYPQQGTAKFDADTKTWRMPFTSIGLDGTKSHGEYVLVVTDNNTIDWSLNEWADGLHTIKKFELIGTYTRRK